MANSDKKQFRDAFAMRQELLEDGALSDPADVGATAIICSFASGDNTKSVGETYAPPAEIKQFTDEAYRIADVLLEQKSNPEVILNARYSDIRSVLMDGSFSSVITIGHGTLTSLGLPGFMANIFTWQDAITEATHLKTGRFEQRQCGVMACRLNVPLGAMVVSEVTQVYAAVGRDFNPEYFGDPNWGEPEQVFESVSEFNYYNIIETLARQDDDPEVFDSFLPAEWAQN